MMTAPNAPRNREDSNHHEIVTLREYLEAQIQSIKETMAATDRRIEDKLLAMNELRDQINKERSTYMQRGECTSKHTVIDADVRTLRESKAELAGKASSTALYFTGLVAVTSLFIAVMNLIMRFVADKM